MKKSEKAVPHTESNGLLTKALGLVEQSDYRLTRTRRVLLEAILKQKKPFSPRGLEKLLAGKADIDFVTIYRTLPVLVKLGIIEKCDFSDDMAHYEVILGREGPHHHHIVCRSCKKVEPLEFCIVGSQEQLLRKLGYTDLKHRLEFTGRCPSCS